jgi:hypothetical protein
MYFTVFLEVWNYKFFSLMFVPCIIRRSGNNQHYALISTTLLFYVLARTCFSSSLPKHVEASV